MRELKRLNELIDRYNKEKRVRQIADFAVGFKTGLHASIYRGGQYMIDTDSIKELCVIEEGVGYLDNDRLRKIIHYLYEYKKVNNVIFITATALCKLVLEYGVMFPALPIVIRDFGFTNLWDTLRKFMVSLFVFSIVPVWAMAGPYAAVVIGSGCLYIAYRLLLIKFYEIPTSPVDDTIPVSKLQPRIKDLPDVVTINARNKIHMTNPNPARENVECWMPDQRMFNKNCKLKSTDIPNAIDLAYDDVVNMKDVTSLKDLEDVRFTDILDLGKPVSKDVTVTGTESLGQCPCPPVKSTMKSMKSKMKSKAVNFLKIFGDQDHIDEIDTWETSEYTIPEKTNIKIRD